MTEYLLLLLSICVNVTGSSINNRFAKQKCTDPVVTAAYNLLVPCAGLGMILFLGGRGSCSPVTVGMGLLFGLLNSGSIVARTAALSCGPMALTLLIGSCGMLIPTFSGVLFWNEEMGIVKLTGVLIMILALFCILGKQENCAGGWKWAGLCAVSFLCTGGISVMQKIHQNSAYTEERTAFLATAFLVSICLNGTMFLISKRKHQEIRVLLELSLVGSGILTGACTGTIHILNLYLSGVIPAVIFFPLVNGGAILLSGLVGMLFFREKCTGQQITGFCMGLAAILCISGIFG